MKRVLSIIALMVFIAVSLSAETKTIKIDNERTDDKFKAGVMLGYPTGLTAGWRIADALELNFIAATHYRDITLGFAPLFTLVNIDISGETFPLSVGPAAYLNIGWGGGLDLDVLGNVRIEYSFDEIPLNLFLEGGIGITVIPAIRPQGSGAFGIRYIF